RSEPRAGKISWRLLLPLTVLSFFAIGAGFLEIPSFLAGGYGAGMDLNASVALQSLAAVFLGITAASILYSKRDVDNEPLRKILGPVYTLVENKFYLDHFFQNAADFFKTHTASAFDWNDQKIIIGGMVNGAAGALRGAGAALRRLQTGAIQLSQAGLIAGVIALLWISLWPKP
ncbi:MAG: hypothetical protein WCG06_03685, partial [Candidatus Omnitrophota bacterium]